jgi:hypothetical protein
MNRTVTDDDLLALDSELREVLEAVRARGWRDAEIRHVIAKGRNSSAPDLLDHLEQGIESWRLRRGETRERARAVGALLCALLRFLPALPPLESCRHDRADESMLVKVRALLAKADSTEFPAESQALTAKAHALMARHAIDRAAVDGAPPTGVATCRVLIDDPYAKQRAALLMYVAGALGCRVLSWSGLGIATVFGFATDVEATELLYTSLLLQATDALLKADATQGGSHPSTVAAFRRAFLLGFAQRIGQRLSSGREAVIDEAHATHGDDLLPVLADRADAIDAAIEPFLNPAGKPRRASRYSNLAGLGAGHVAGARASLSQQPRLSSHRAIAPRR